jgi:hypothetical protein
LKKFASILFLTIYLFSTTEAIQLFKISAAIEHFAEHKAENPSLTFLAFLEIHYLHGSPKDKDYEKDMKLPFKTPCDGVCIANVALVPSSFNFIVYEPLVSFEKKNYILLNQCAASAYLSNIWQPPKVS